MSIATSPLQQKVEYVRFGLSPSLGCPVLLATVKTMSQPIPKTSKQWNVVSGHDGFDSLKFSEQSVPELGDNQVLVKSMYWALPTRLVL